MTTIQGTNIHCGIVNTATNVFTQFALSRKASITMKRDMQEVSSPESGQDKEYIPARKGWKMSVGCLLSNDEQVVWNAYDNGEKIMVSWRETQGTECREFTGYAYVANIKATGNLHEMATFNIELQGTGKLYYRKVNPIYVKVVYESKQVSSRAYNDIYTLSLYSDSAYTQPVNAPITVKFGIRIENPAEGYVAITQGQQSGTGTINAEWSQWPYLYSPLKSDYNFIIQPQQS